ncbi:unnamed protein product [Oikopleura dioica]|uniref:Ribonuclease P/MRP protein subunit POP5 n=1 Tax=Oikopleura dioica TaxID=34765 RepID=E4X0Q5_OIKDI|nr:unnamed protein product [Oikopleura dioica]
MVRYKNRNLLIQIRTPDKQYCGIYLTPNTLREAILKALRCVLGMNSSVVAGNLRVKYVNCWTNLAVITVRTQELVNLRCALPFVTALEHGSKGSRCVILKTIKVSGTIRGCQREIKNLHSLAFHQASNNAELQQKVKDTEKEIEERLNIDD